MTVPYREIRAQFDAQTIRVYQAYSNEIADVAVQHQRFCPPFKMERMTWIKPSFLWMMYRAGWGEKDAGQQRILAIDISREGFEWALANGCIAHFEAPTYGSHEEWQARKAATNIRIQWDPERDLNATPLPHRALQLGLSGEAVKQYVHHWTTAITDITPMVKQIKTLVDQQQFSAAADLLPVERPYATPAALLPLCGLLKQQK